MQTMSNGWDQSAAAWIESQGDKGDWGRANVLDRPMLALALAARPQAALDVGCGEGRFCRMLAAEGVRATGIDPTAALIEAARARDPAGDYQIGAAEALAFPDAAFDLVVSYLSLIDIDGAETAIREMRRVLRSGGRLLVANLNAFTSAGEPDGWRRGFNGALRYSFDNYLDQRSQQVAWRGISITNWHRPLSFYFKAFLAEGLVLKSFDEPEPHSGAPEKIDRYRRAPNFCIMEWEKP